MKATSSKQLRASHVAIALLAPLLLGATQRDVALERALRAHIEVLASDDFEGREPGTPGETKTLRYLAREWFRIGLVSGTNDPGNAWFAPVEVVEREPARSLASFARNRRPAALPADGVLVLTSSPRQLLENAPLLLVGRGDGALPTRRELAGKIAVLLDAGNADVDRPTRLLEAGASAVLTVLDGERGFYAVAERRRRPAYAVAGATLGGDLEAFVSREYAARLFGAELDAMRSAAAQPGFASRPIALTGTLEATTRETRIGTHNLIGRLPGRFPERGAVLLVAHWDHFGICAEPPAEDLICNGAIDNASGVAVLTEIARALAREKKLDRDVYFLATTAEELGLLGAHAFATNPPVPIDSIVAALNIDSPALAPRGRPLAIIGQGLTSLDADIARVAKAQKRRLDRSNAGAPFLKRQDGWALLQYKIPAVMVSSSYSDPALVERFMEQTYHRPSDGAADTLELGAAADDTAFHVALVKWFATLKSHPGKTAR